MRYISLEDLDHLNILNQKTWGWSLKVTSERGDGDFQKFTVFAIDPFTKMWHTIDGTTIPEAVEKFIKIIGV